MKRTTPLRWPSPRVDVDLVPGALVYFIINIQPDRDRLLDYLDLGGVPAIGSGVAERLEQSDRLIRVLGGVKWLAMVRAGVRGSRR